MTETLPISEDRDRLVEIFGNEAAIFARVPPDEHWLSEEAASIYVGLHLRTLQRLRREGKGPEWSGSRRRYRYRRSALIEWLSRQDYW